MDQNDMLTHRVAIALISVIVGFNHATATAAPPAPIKMYRDESRCMQLGIPVWQHLHVPDGLFQTRVMDLIEDERLCEYDVIVIQNQIESIAYSANELKALRQFVARGGGLLLVGNPSPSTANRAKFRKGQLAEAPRPLPARQFSSNQVADLFEMAFTNTSRTGVPAFKEQDALAAGVEVRRLGFEQPLGLLLAMGNFRPLVTAFGDPVVAAAEYEKGRVIVCAAPRLLASYGSLPERKLGQTDAVIDQQKRLLLNWLTWLAGNSPVRDRPSKGYPDSVPGRLHLTGDQIEIYTIPQLEKKAKELEADWAKVWPALARHVGVRSPLELVGKAAADDKLEVYLRASPAGGLSGGTRVSIPAMGGDERLIAVLGHEVGHKLLGGCNTSVSEAFAEWLGAKALAAAGQRAAAKAKIERHLADFRAADPAGTALDIADEQTDIKQSPACQGKWIWILTELCDKYGDDLPARYLAALRENVPLSNPARKLVVGEEERLTMSDHVQAMSKAAGEDLTGWFRGLGITVDSTAKAKQRR